MQRLSSNMLAAKAVMPHADLTGPRGGCKVRRSADKPIGAWRQETHGAVTWSFHLGGLFIITSTCSRCSLALCLQTTSGHCSDDTHAGRPDAEWHMALVASKAGPETQTLEQHLLACLEFHCLGPTKHAACPNLTLQGCPTGSRACTSTRQGPVPRWPLAPQPRSCASSPVQDAVVLHLRPEDVGLSRGVHSWHHCHHLARPTCAQHIVLEADAAQLPPQVTLCSRGTGRLVGVSAVRLAPSRWRRQGENTRGVHRIHLSCSRF